jgi:cobalamin-dependent methionine synthase I
MEDGEERMSKVLPLAKKFGAAVVALTIDERGMAKESGEKIAVAERIVGLACDKWKMRPSDLPDRSAHVHDLHGQRGRSQARARHARRDRRHQEAAARMPHPARAVET